eukprot:2980737-Pyramimonas_sp.AAC.2
MHLFLTPFEQALATILKCARCERDIELRRAEGEQIVAWSHAAKTCPGRWNIGEKTLEEWQKLSTRRYSTHAKYIEEYNLGNDDKRDSRRHLLFSMQRNFTMRYACRRPLCKLNCQGLNTKRIRYYAETTCTGMVTDEERNGGEQIFNLNMDRYDKLPEAQGSQ